MEETKTGVVTARWIKRQVSKREYTNHYSQLPAYCFLEENTEGVLIGFLTVHNEEMGMFCDEEDLRRIDMHRRAGNIHPMPFGEKKKKVEAVKKTAKVGDVINIDEIPF